MRQKHRRPRRLRIALLSVALLASGLAAASLPAGAVVQAEGIDVSHWQGTIDWTKVAGAGKTFAFVKATDGTTVVDDAYGTNRAGANRVGIPIGAYHFGRATKDPGVVKGAIAEATWFLDHASVAKGDLPPVLDLERKNGLSQTKLTTWILAWLEEVRQQTGIYSLVYTSPSGWADRTGDTTDVAAAGYGLLWLAHWTDGTPNLPANGWNGNGWTFWQYTSSGSVAGISGDVDLDRYKEASLSGILLRQLTITKASVAGRFGGVKQDGLGAFCDGSCAGATRLSVGGATTTLAPQSSDPTTTWSWGGACAGTPNGAACTLTMGADMDVTITYLPATVPVTVTASGNGSGSVTSVPAGISCTAAAGVTTGACAAPFAYTSSLTLTANAAAGSSFAGWSGACTGTGTCALTADGDKNVTATFTLANGATLTLKTSGTGAGTVTPWSGSACASICTSSYPLGTSGNVTQAAASGSIFVGWTGGTCTATGTCSVTMDRDRTVIGWFAPLYTRTVSIRASASRVSSGTQVTLSGTLATTNATWCPVGSKPVKIMRAGTLLTTVSTTASGTWSYAISPTTTATYTALVDRVYPTTLGDPVCEAAMSSSVKVTVR